MYTFDPQDLLIYFAIKHTWVETPIITQFFPSLRLEKVAALRGIFALNAELTHINCPLNRIITISKQFTQYLQQTTFPDTVKTALIKELVAQFAWIRDLSLIDLIAASCPSQASKTKILDIEDKLQRYSAIRTKVAPCQFGSFILCSQLYEFLIFISTGRCDTGRTMMHFIAAYAGPALAECLSSKDVARYILEKGDANNITPLLHAVRAGNVAMYDWFCRNQGNQDHNCAKGRNRLHYAIVSGNLAFVKRFLAEESFVTKNKDLKWSKIFKICQRMIETLNSPFDYSHDVEEINPAYRFSAPLSKTKTYVLRQNYQEIWNYLLRYLSENFTQFTDPEIPGLLEALSPCIYGEIFAPKLPQQQNHDNRNNQQPEPLVGDSPRKSSRLLSRSLGG